MLTTDEFLDAIKTRYNRTEHNAYPFAVGYLWETLTLEQQEKVAEHLSNTPCNVCETPVKTDIHKEELGMCVECSHAYFDHKDEE